MWYIIPPANKPADVCRQDGLESLNGEGAPEASRHHHHRLLLTAALGSAFKYQNSLSSVLRAELSHLLKETNFFLVCNQILAPPKWSNETRLCPTRTESKELRLLFVHTGWETNHFPFAGGNGCSAGQVGIICDGITSVFSLEQSFPLEGRINSQGSWIA